METTRHFTATVYVVNDGATALHEHKRLGIHIPPGGHVDRDELPHEAALREVREETGLEATLLDDTPTVRAAPARRSRTHATPSSTTSTNTTVRSATSTSTSSTTPRRPPAESTPRRTKRRRARGSGTRPSASGRPTSPATSPNSASRLSRPQSSFRSLPARCDVASLRSATLLTARCTRRSAFRDCSLRSQSRSSRGSFHSPLAVTLPPFGRPRSRRSFLARPSTGGQ